MALNIYPLPTVEIDAYDMAVDRLQEVHALVGEAMGVEITETSRDLDGRAVFHLLTATEYAIGLKADYAIAHANAALDALVI